MADLKSGQSLTVNFTVTDTAESPQPINLAILSELKVYIFDQAKNVLAQFARDAETGFDNDHFEVTNAAAGQFSIYIQYADLEGVAGNIYAEVVIESTDSHFPTGLRKKSWDINLSNLLKSASDGH